MNEDIFYLFTQAMDLKYADTVEAIYDLCEFCIATENADIWREIYNFVRTKAQQIIDTDNQHDKEDCIAEFESNDWIKQYIKKVKGDNMGYSYTNVIKVIKNFEEDILFDVEAPSHWYMIKYKDNKLIISEVDEYHFNGDEWGEIEVKSNISEIKSFECTLKEYTNFIIRFFKEKRVWKEHKYPSDNFILDQIDVMVVE